MLVPAKPVVQNWSRAAFNTLASSNFLGLTTPAS
jgi:hypothetical protein